SYVSLATLDVGFRADGLLTMVTRLADTAYPNVRARAAFLDAAAERVAALPGVEGAAVVNVLPLSGLGSTSTTAVEGRPVPPPDRRPSVLTRDVTPDFHRVFGIPLLAGRLLTRGDSLGAPRVAVVSRALARQLFPGENPIGRRLIHMRDSAYTIVGVVEDIRDEALDVPPKPTVYMPNAQDADNVGCLAVRTRGDPRALEGAVRRVLAGLDPEQTVIAVQPMTGYLASSVETRRFSLFLTAVFAGTALVLAMVGLYGVLAYLVGQRTREIGVRVALGARRADVAGLVLGGAVRLAGTGVAIGVPAALLAARLLRAQLYGVGPSDPLTFVVVGAALVGTAGLAALVPTRRAARVDPVVALRSE
ncbi:MAG: ABC transporter permease, partial [Gemmatirosa sp.]|nr:ABC transporter permease [Gemmatirosa sp.]